MGGATGLDYFVAYHRMDRMNLSPTEYDQLDAELQVMEAAALQIMHAKE
jgi:NAD-dependent DNA ligase